MVVGHCKRIHGIVAGGSSDSSEHTLGDSKCIYGLSNNCSVHVVGDSKRCHGAKFCSTPCLLRTYVAPTTARRMNKAAPNDPDPIRKDVSSLSPSLSSSKFLFLESAIDKNCFVR